MPEKSFHLMPEPEVRDSSAFRWRVSTVALVLALVTLAWLQLFGAGHDGSVLEFVANIFVIPCAVGVAAIASGYRLARRRTVQNGVEFAASVLLVAFLVVPLARAYWS